jgi:hypothetical protein
MNAHMQLDFFLSPGLTTSGHMVCHQDIGVNFTTLFLSLLV